MREIKLMGCELVAKIDDSDFDLISQFYWRPHKHRNTHYAYARKMKDRIDKGIKMHRLILGLKKGDPDVDHIDGDGLNNQRSNLRLCTNSQNAQNRRRRKNGTSPYKGVSLYNQKYLSKTTGEIRSCSASHWKAQIMVNKKVISLGYFPHTKDGEIQAAISYNEAAKKHFGEFARLNNIPEDKIYDFAVPKKSVQK